MHFLRTLILAASTIVPSTVLAAPANDATDLNLYKRENLCNLRAPPQLCTPNSTITVEEIADRAYKFYRAFVVEGDPRTMFSLIDSTYTQHHPGYSSGPNVIWPLFCNGNPVGTERSSAWCFDASTNMSYAQYSTTDRWRWLDGCVHEHWDMGEVIPKDKCYKLPTTTTTTPPATPPTPPPTVSPSPY